MPLFVKRRAFIAGAGAMIATPALAQPPEATPPAPSEAATPATPAAPAGPPPVPAGAVRVNLRTGAGLIVIDLYADKAPITAGNFLRLIDQRRFDGSTIYRASRPGGATDYGVIQGGIKFDPARPVRSIAHEPTTKTGILHKSGAISMGRNAPGTAQSDFFICIGDQPYLDANPSAPGDNLGYAAFGQVVEGMDVAKAILVMPVHPTRGPMVGQMLQPPVPIVNLRRAPPATG